MLRCSSLLFCWQNDKMYSLQENSEEIGWARGRVQICDCRQSWLTAGKKCLYVRKQY